MYDLKNVRILVYELLILNTKKLVPILVMGYMRYFFFIFPTHQNIPYIKISY